MCVGPVSPDTITAAPRASATRSAIVVFGDSIAAPPAARDDRRRERLFAGSPQDDRRQTVPLAQRRRDRAEARRRPALVRPRRARVQQRVAAAGLPARRRAPPPSRRWSIGNSGAAAVRCRASCSRPRLMRDDVARFARIVDAAAAGIVDVGVEQPRQPLARVRAVKPIDPRRAGRAGEQRRLDAAPADRSRRRSARGAARAIARPAATLAARCAGRSSTTSAAIDHRDEIEDLAVLRADQPVDARRGKRAAQRRGDRNGVHDVAQRAEADDQEARSPGVPGPWCVVLGHLVRRWSVVRAASGEEIARGVVLRVADDRRAAAVAGTTARSGTESTV